MKSFNELHEAFNNVKRDDQEQPIVVDGVAELVRPELKVFVVMLPEGQSPYSELSNYATADFQVANLGDGFYAASVGEFTGDVALEVTE